MVQRYPACGSQPRPRLSMQMFYLLPDFASHPPPLRKRTDDIPELARYFLKRHAAEAGRLQLKDFVAEAIARLVSYPWPGNVRELENVIERAVALSRGSSIGIDAMPPTLLRPPKAVEEASIPADGIDLGLLLADYERSMITEALRMCDGVKKRAARLLGLSFRSLRYRLDKLGIDSSPRDSSQPGAV